MQYSWPAPVPPGGRQGTIRLIRCAGCGRPLYHTKAKGRPQPEDHEQGCQVFVSATQVMGYADELKRSAGRSPLAWGRTWRRRYLRANAQQLSAAACASDPAAAVSVLCDLYEAECQPHGKRARLPAPEKREMAQTLKRACQQLALGQQPAPVSPRSR